MIPPSTLASSSGVGVISQRWSCRAGTMNEECEKVRYPVCPSLQLVTLSPPDFVPAQLRKREGEAALSPSIAEKLTLVQLIGDSGSSRRQPGVAYRYSAPDETMSTFRSSEFAAGKTRRHHKGRDGCNRQQTAEKASRKQTRATESGSRKRRTAFGSSRIMACASRQRPKPYVLT